MKKLLPAIVSISMLILLLVITLLSDRLIDKKRMEQVATIPDFSPPVSSDVLATEPHDGENAKAPNITLTDAQGNTVTLDQFRGKTVVINFWASWSGPSYRELAMYQQAYDEYKDEVYFLMVNTTSDDRETKEKADQMIADYGFTFPVYYDLDASAANAYQVISLPTSFFIDANGKAVAYAAGELTRYGFELGMQACAQSVEQAGGIQTPDATEPTDTTVPTEEA